LFEERTGDDQGDVRIVAAETAMSAIFFNDVVYAQLGQHDDIRRA